MNGTYVQCTTPTSGVEFVGDWIFLRSTRVNVSFPGGCREACESGELSAMAKGWTLFPNGSCACYKAINDIHKADKGTVT